MPQIGICPECNQGPRPLPSLNPINKKNHVCNACYERLRRRIFNIEKVFGFLPLDELEQRILNAKGKTALEISRELGACLKQIELRMESSIPAKGNVGTFEKAKGKYWMAKLPAPVGVGYNKIFRPAS